MKYPKPVMKMQELVRQMGFPEEYLCDAYRVRGQRFAWKKDPQKPNSIIIFDTEEFEKWRMRCLVMENKSIPRGRA